MSLYDLFVIAQYFSKGLANQFLACDAISNIQPYKSSDEQFMTAKLEFKASLPWYLREAQAIKNSC